MEGVRRRDDEVVISQARVLALVREGATVRAAVEAEGLTLKAWDGWRRHSEFRALADHALGRDIAHQNPVTVNDAPQRQATASAATSPTRPLESSPPPPRIRNCHLCSAPMVTVATGVRCLSCSLVLPR